MEHDEYGTDKKVSEITALSRQTLKKLRMGGNGPHYVKVGRAIRYHLPTVLTWMAQHQRRSTSEIVSVPGDSGNHANPTKARTARRAPTRSAARSSG